MACKLRMATPVFRLIEYSLILLLIFAKMDVPQSRLQPFVAGCFRPILLKTVGLGFYSKKVRVGD